MLEQKITCTEISQKIAEFYPGRLCLSISETARLLGVDRRTVQSAIDRRVCSLPYMRVGGKKVVPITGLCRWIFTNTL